jgi:hypothetical protein
MNTDIREEIKVNTAGPVEKLQHNRKAGKAL